MKTIFLLPLLASVVVVSAVQHVMDPATYHQSNSCNGDERYCKLRYDQYTFPGTHDSAANRLNLDCDLLDGKLPRLAKILKLPKAICSAATHFIPKNVYNCFWNCQPDHDLEHQLHDGIRWLDLRGCLDGKNLWLCHGAGADRALGIDFHTAFAEIAKFLNAFKREVITISFEASDGDPAIIHGHLAEIMQQYVGDMMYTHTEGQAWPTLQQMIDSNKRILIYSNWEKIDDPSLPPWLHLNRNKLCYRTWNFSDTIHRSNDLKDAMVSFCNTPQPPAIANKWQTLEYSIPTSPGTIAKDVTHLIRPELCLKKLATDSNTWMFDVAKVCVPKMSFVHEVQVDYYFSSPVFEMVDWINEVNLKRASL